MGYWKVEVAVAAVNPRSDKSAHQPNILGSRNGSFLGVQAEPVAGKN
jgi:hypothetical protein